MGTRNHGTKPHPFPARTITTVVPGHRVVDLSLRRQKPLSRFGVNSPFNYSPSFNFPKKISALTGSLVYSPDGRSLACGFTGSIVIWDVQTGGVARSIDCRCAVSRLVWSLDGKTIGISLLCMDKSSLFKTYDVASSAQLFAEKFYMEWIFDIWACEKSFRFLSIPYVHGLERRLSISEIGPTRINIEQLPVTASPTDTIAFSPSTYLISISGPSTFHILDSRNDKTFLYGSHSRPFSCFSSDASLLAAPHGNGFRVWKYTSGSHPLLGEYPLPHFPSFYPGKLHLQFSRLRLQSCLGTRMFSRSGVCTIPPPLPRPVVSTLLFPASVVTSQLSTGHRAPSQ